MLSASASLLLSRNDRTIVNTTDTPRRHSTPPPYHLVTHIPPASSRLDSGTHGHLACSSSLPDAHASEPWSRLTRRGMSTPGTKVCAGPVCHSRGWPLCYPSRRHPTGPLPHTLTVHLIRMHGQGYRRSVFTLRGLVGAAAGRVSLRAGCDEVGARWLSAPRLSLGAGFRCLSQRDTRPPERGAPPERHGHHRLSTTDSVIYECAHVYPGGTRRWRDGVAVRPRRPGHDPALARCAWEKTLAEGDTSFAEREGGPRWGPQGYGLTLLVEWH